MKQLKHSICDEKVFDAFFKAHAKFLKDYLFYKFGDADEAEDVLQEAFVKLWHNCAQVPVEKAKSYLYTVATNLQISLKRHNQVKLKYRENESLKTDSISSESPEHILLGKEYMDKLTHVISSLPDRQREVFLLNRVEKKTYKEIAEISGVSVKAIEKLMHKALIKMRKDIGDI